MDNENLENQEPSEVSPAKNENMPGEMDVEPPKEEIRATGDKKSVDLLLKKKQIAIAAVGGGIGLFFLILVASLSTTGINNKPYYETKCQNVTVIYEPYDESESSSTKTMTMEGYIESAVHEYTKDIVNPPNGIFQVYYALAVALRTEAISNDCKVTYRDKKFTSAASKDEVLESALTAANGVIIADENDKIIPSRVSDFCWNNVNTNEYTMYQAPNLVIPVTFINTYLTNEVYRDCPCNSPDSSQDKCWVTWEIEEVDEEGNVTTSTGKNYLHMDDKTGFSVYGAYYLMMQHGKGYDEILRYFFGNNIKYMTINSKTEKQESSNNNSTTNCSQFSLTNTTLSKEEFVSKVEKYNYSGSSAWSNFVTNAGRIYDMATSNNVNPEMIYVRAILEGFSPGVSKHNYFGINCVNGHPEKCRVFTSFDEGIMGFINVVKKYDSYESFAGRYAYLGDYWFNPGNSGDGGCYYAKYIYPNGLDSYVQDACSESRKGRCYANGDKSGCVATREEDKKAYAVYQGRNMTNMRYRIFGIQEDSCTNNTMNYGSCRIFAQGDSRWGNETLGFGPSTIHGAGCALTSIAIAMTCTGETEEDFTPLVLNEALKANNGFDGDLIYWGNSALQQFVPTFRLGATYSIKKSDSNKSKIDILKNGLQDNRIGIVHIINSNHSAGHFIVLQSIDASNNTITALDPAGGKVATYSINDIDGFKYYTY